jgi:hypothetical protein
MDNLLIVLPSGDLIDHATYSSIYAICSTVFTCHISTLDDKPVKFDKGSNITDQLSMHLIDPSMFQCMIVPHGLNNIIVSSNLTLIKIFVIELINGRTIL